MRELREVLKGSFDSHADALGNAASSWDGLAERSVRDTRNRRAWRAGAASTVAAAAVVGIVATAVAVAGGGDALNPAQRLVMDDPDSLGECTAYIPANGAVLLDGMYAGRSYVDPEAGFVVAVMPDGTVTRVQSGPNGDYPFDFGYGPTELIPGGNQTADMGPLVIDHMSDGSAAGGEWEDAEPVGWGWTAEPLAPTPAGVNVRSLYATFAMSFGFVGLGFEPSAVPESAVAEAVAIYADGHEVSEALVQDMPAPSTEEIELTGLTAMALRVTLADGQVWEIRANYDPSGIPDLPCQPTPPSAATS